VTRLSRTAVKRRIKHLSPVIGPMYTRLRYRARPLIGPVATTVRHLRVRRGDAFLASYPRSGNTWLRFMLFEALTGRPAQFDAVRRAIPHVNPYQTAEPIVSGVGRLYLTHEQYSHVYGGFPAIYLVRDVRDVVLSEYRRQQMNESYPGAFDAFLEDFLAGRIHRFGSWNDHVAGWRFTGASDRRSMLLRYEDLRRDPARGVSDALSFLGAPRPADVVERAVEHNALDAMRGKEDRTTLPDARPGFRFVNAGASGSWRDRLSAEQIRRIESVTGATLERLGYEVG